MDKNIESMWDDNTRVNQVIFMFCTVGLFVCTCFSIFTYIVEHNLRISVVFHDTNFILQRCLFVLAYISLFFSGFKKKTIISLLLAGSFPFGELWLQHLLDEELVMQSISLRHNMAIVLTLLLQYVSFLLFCVYVYSTNVRNKYLTWLSILLSLGSLLLIVFSIYHSPRVVWKFDLPSCSSAKEKTASIYFNKNKMLAYCLGSQTLYSVSAKVGMQEWQFKAPSKIRRIYIESGEIYIETQLGIYSVDATTGKLRWMFQPKKGLARFITIQLYQNPSDLPHPDWQI